MSKRQVKPPPDEWRPDLSDDIRMTTWHSLGRANRSNVVQRAKKRQRYFGDDYDPLEPQMPLGTATLPPPLEWRQDLYGEAERYLEWRLLTKTERSGFRQTLKHRKRRANGEPEPAPTQPAPVPTRQPPAEWRPELVDSTTRYTEWCALHRHDRSNFTAQEDNRNRIMQTAREAVQNGNAGQRQLSYLKNQGTLRHAMGFSQRSSADTLQFRLKHSKGCIRVGCVLAPPKDSDGIGSLMLFALLEFDHRNAKEKTNCVTLLRGPLRDEEVLKTDCVCLWCHYLHTCEQMDFGVRPPSTIGLVLRQWKLRTGCEHPCHASMPYASLVPTAEVNPLVFGFLEVSHKVRGTRRSYKPADHLEDLTNGAAVIHCSFCHNLWTLCEFAQVCTTPLVTHQYALLQQQHPEFVRVFKEVTKDVDWVAMRLGERTMQSNAMKRSWEVRKARSAAGIDMNDASEEEEFVDVCTSWEDTLSNDVALEFDNADDTVAEAEATGDVDVDGGSDGNDAGDDVKEEDQECQERPAQKKQRLQEKTT